MQIRLRRAAREHAVHVHAHVVRRDVALIAGAREPLAVLGHTIEVLGRGKLFAGAVGRHPVLDVVAVAAALIAVEAVGAAPHLAQGRHRNASGTDRARRVGVLGQKQRERAGGAVRLDGQLIDDIRGGDAPVRQRAGMGIDIGEHQVGIAEERLAGQRAFAVHHRVFCGHADGDLLSAAILRLAQLLGGSGGGQAAGGKVRGERGQGQQQRGHQRQHRADQLLHVGMILL